MKRTYVIPSFILLAACIGGLDCGASNTDPADPGVGGGGSGQTSTDSSGTGQSGGHGGGLGGALPVDGGEHACPGQRPIDGSDCSTKSTCTYPDGICNCIRQEKPDAASWREWSCFDTAPGACHHVQPESGQVCMSPGLRCPSNNADSATCVCAAEDGSLQWHC